MGRAGESFGSEGSYSDQQSRNQWVKDGDTNSKFFHKCVESRGRLKGFSRLRIKGRWVEGVSELKEGARLHFLELFSQNSGYRKLRYEALLGLKLGREDASSLEVGFSAEEIKAAVWDCGVDKSLGPDGYNFQFFRACWGLIENDVLSSSMNFTLTLGSCVD